MEGIGPYIRKRRDELDLSLRELAKKLDCSPAFISDIELGRRHPSEKVLAEIDLKRRTLLRSVAKRLTEIQYGGAAALSVYKLGLKGRNCGGNLMKAR